MAKASRSTNLQFVEGAPSSGSLLWTVFGFAAFHRRHRANTSTFAIAMGISRQIEQNVFAQEWREIDLFRASYLNMDGEVRNLDLEGESLKAAHATKFNRLGQLAIRPKRTF